MQGTIHPYYTVALAPAIGALVGIGSVLLWRHRAVAPRAAYGVLALTVLVTGGWGFELLRTDASFHPQVRYLEVAAAVAAVVLLAATALWTRTGRRLLVAAGAVTALALAIPTAAWALGTAATPHSGSIPTAVSGSGSAGFATGSSGAFGGFGGGGAPGGGSARQARSGGRRRPRRRHGGTGGTGAGGTGTGEAAPVVSGRERAAPDLPGRLPAARRLRDGGRRGRRARA